MFASQTMDLYHIETDRKGGYIEFAVRQIYRAEPSEAYRQIASVDRCSASSVLIKDYKKLRLFCYANIPHKPWLPCVKGAVAKRLRDCFGSKSNFYNPSVTLTRATSLYTREAFFYLSEGKQMDF